jgi:hypothetical protein
VPDLLRYAEGSPFLLLALVILGAVLYAAEKLFALSGPMSGLVHWWQGRELAKLKRDAEVRAARRAIQAEEESALLRDLRGQLAELETNVGRLREERRRREAHDRAMREWAEGLLRAARAAGLRYIDPPSTGEQEAVTV